MKKFEFTKPQILEKSISWFIFHVGNLKLLGRLNGLSTCAVDVDAVDDYV